MEDVVAQLHQLCDVLIIDSPPVTAVADQLFSLTLRMVLFWLLKPTAPSPLNASRYSSSASASKTIGGRE